MALMELDRSVLAEMEIAREMDRIVAKMLDGTATPQDRVQYQELSARRSKLMSPPADYHSGRSDFRRAG